MTVDGRMPGIDLTIASRPIAVGGMEQQGRGRLRSIIIETAVHGRGTPLRTGRYTLTAPTYGSVQQTTCTPADDDQTARTGATRRTLAAAQ